MAEKSLAEMLAEDEARRASSPFPAIDAIVQSELDHDAARALFDDRNISAERLAWVCQQKGYRISATRIREYRRYLGEQS